MGERICSIEACATKSTARGWCMKHYLRWRRHGDPEDEGNVGGYRPIAERFWNRVATATPSECWPWTGYVGPNGYGYIGGERNGPILLAHRVSYQLNVGEIPSALTIDHLCANRICVNPSHLEAVELEENIRRAFDRRSALLTAET